MSDYTEQYCRRASAWMAREAVPGMGTWPQTWEILDMPARIFVGKLAELDAGTTNVKQVEAAAKEFAKAFERARAEFQRAEAA